MKKCIARTQKGKKCKRPRINKFPYLFCEEHRNIKRVLGFFVKVASILAFFVLIMNTFQFFDWVTDLFTPDPKECSFNQNNSDFKILILPFRAMTPNSSRDIGLEIYERINEMDQNENLNVELCYHKNYDFKGDFNHSSAVFERDSYGADMVVYGNYSNNDCSGTKEEVCYNWAVKNSINVSELQENTSYEFKNININDFRNGALQAETDFIVYWLAGLTYFENKSYRKASLKFNYILDHLIEVDAQRLLIETYIASIYCYNVLGEHEAAVEKLNDYINELTEDNTCLDSIKYFQLAADTYGGVSEFELSIKNAKTALAIIENGCIQGKRHLPQIYLSFQSVYEYIGQNELSINYGLELLKLQKEETNLSNHELNGVYNTLGLAYNSLKDKEMALIYQGMAVNLFKTTHPIDSLNLIKAQKNYTSLFIYRDSDSLDLIRSIEELKSYVEFEIRNYSENNLNIGKTYHQIGASYEFLNDFSSAINYYLLALDIKEKQTPLNSFDIQITLGNLGTCYTKIKEHDKAAEYFCKSYEISNSEYPNAFEDLVHNTLNLGLSNFFRNNKLESKFYLEEAYEIGKNLDKKSPYRDNIILLLKQAFDIDVSY